jgi:hypothetical protein
MAETRLTVDGVTLLHDNLGAWRQQPPPDLQALLKPGNPQPWSKPAMVTLVDALLTDTPITITITTNGSHFTMTTSQP